MRSVALQVHKAATAVSYACTHDMRSSYAVAAPRAMHAHSPVPSWACAYTLDNSTHISTSGVPFGTYSGVYISFLISLHFSTIILCRIYAAITHPRRAVDRKNKRDVSSTIFFSHGKGSPICRDTQLQARSMKRSSRQWVSSLLRTPWRTLGITTVGNFYRWLMSPKKGLRFLLYSASS